MGCVRSISPISLTCVAHAVFAGFEYAEHSYIGDAIMLTLANGSRVPARNHRFTLRNGLSVTYGQINGLAGDFYGTTNPISDGRTPQDQSTRFLAAYNKLAEPSSRQPQEARDILAVLQTEVDAVNEALQHHSDPSIAYAKLPGVNTKLETLTIGRPSDFPSYLGLARINWDHFGQDARTTYNAGHLLALQTAVNGDLSRAYSINAFADHFLEDSFSAGHLRTPRRGLHGTVDLFADMCAKVRQQAYTFGGRYLPKTDRPCTTKTAPLVSRSETLPGSRGPASETSARSTVTAAKTSG